MAQTSDEKTIKEITGLGIGKLYYMKVSEETEIRLCVKEGKVFDMESCNFHLYPESEDETDKCAGIIDSLRKAVLNKLKTNPLAFSYGIRVNIRKGNSAFNPVYKYIYAEKNGVGYELNFMRFFIDRDKKVNCIIPALQYDRCVGDYVNKAADGSCDICYPTSYQSAESRLNKLLAERKGKSFCFNPAMTLNGIADADYESTAEMITENFIDFIIKCDNEKG